MDLIDEDKFKEADKLPALKEKTSSLEKISDERFEQMLDDMKNPVDSQKELAVQVKVFLDARINRELTDKGILSDHTRRWVETYNTILEKLHRALYGDKSVNLHLHKVSHSQIAAKMRRVGVLK